MISYRTLFSLPNLLTLMNLCCGILGIFFVFHNRFDLSFFMMLTASGFDFFDGLAARLLKKIHPLGKDLDSLADVVSFGVLPGMMCMEFLQGTAAWKILSFISLLIPLFSALRLAKFNHDMRQRTGFIGVPTPMNGLAWGSLLFPDANNLFQHEYMVLSFTIVSSLLLISELPLPSLKIIRFRGIYGVVYLLLLTSFVFSLFIFRFHALFIFYWVYVLTGILSYFGLLKINE